jgi:hypothetical protein
MKFIIVRVNEENFNISKNNPVYQWGLRSIGKTGRKTPYYKQLNSLQRGDIIAFIKKGGRLIAFGTYNHHKLDDNLSETIGWSGEGWGILISCDNIYECDIAFRVRHSLSVIYWEYGAMGSRLRGEYGSDYLSDHYSYLVNKTYYNRVGILNPYKWVQPPREVELLKSKIINRPVPQTTN